MPTRFNVGLRQTIISHFIRECNLNKENAVKAFNNFRMQKGDDWEKYHAWMQGLIYSFVWEKTPEGFLFWNNVEQLSRK